MLARRGTVSSQTHDRRQPYTSLIRLSGSQVRSRDSQSRWASSSQMKSAEDEHAACHPLQMAQRVNRSLAVLDNRQISIMSSVESCAMSTFSATAPSRGVPSCIITSDISVPSVETSVLDGPVLVCAFDWASSSRDAADGGAISAGPDAHGLSTASMRYSLPPPALGPPGGVSCVCPPENGFKK